MTTLEIPRSLLTVRDAETLQPWADELAERGVNLAACRLIVADDSSSNFNLHRYILESEGGAWWSCYRDEDDEAFRASDDWSIFALAPAKVDAA